MPIKCTSACGRNVTGCGLGLGSVQATGSSPGFHTILVIQHDVCLCLCGRKAGAKCLVHCKMGVSRSASTVIAYAMKEYGWDLDKAFDYVKEKRAVTKPNPSFMKQLEEYQGILLARYDFVSSQLDPPCLQYYGPNALLLCFHSKQRHNKLWRSHSDSDLSDRPESMCKPSSESLGRSSSHSNNNNTSSPSLHHFLGVAVLQTLAAEPEDSARSLNRSTPISHKDSNGVCESAGQEGATSVCEDTPPLCPLPRPQAATLVPDERLDNSASVVVTVPVALPHPPPSLHILPPTPELQRARRGPPTHSLSQSLPEHNPLELSLRFPEQSSSEEVSPLSLGSPDSDIISRSLSDSPSDKRSPLSPAHLTNPPLVLPLASSDDNNNPNELQTGNALGSRGDADGSSSHSTDSINFFSAREKFLGLAQDGRSRTPPEQAQQRMPRPLEEETEATEEEEQEFGTSQVWSHSARFNIWYGCYDSLHAASFLIQLCGYVRRHSVCSRSHSSTTFHLSWTEY